MSDDLFQVAFRSRLIAAGYATRMELVEIAGPLGEQKVRDDPEDCVTIAVRNTQAPRTTLHSLGCRRSPACLDHVPSGADQPRAAARPDDTGSLPCARRLASGRVGSRFPRPSALRAANRRRPGLGAPEI
jgi:hypothetical protein